MWSFLSAIFGKLFDWFVHRGQSNLAEVADSNARAQERLKDATGAAETIDKAARIRTDATARVMRAADSKGSLDADKEGHWRD